MTHIKIPDGVASSQHWGSGDRQVPKAHWPGSLAFLVSSRPVRDSVKKKKKQVPNKMVDSLCAVWNNIRGCPLAFICMDTHVHEYTHGPAYPHTPAHTAQTHRVLSLVHTKHCITF